MSEEYSQELLDYLSEFDSCINFDNEKCPVCGIKLNDEITIDNHPLKLLCTITEKVPKRKLISYLDQKEIYYFKSVDIVEEGEGKCYKIYVDKEYYSELKDLLDK